MDTNHQHTHEITISLMSDGSSYKCRFKDKESEIEYLKYVPRPVLTVSPSWTSPGDSVTLTCRVGPPSAGWRFFWYKAVPDLSSSYTYELLAGGTTGTEQDSYILHGQTHTAGYVCRAGRGDPVSYTEHSDVKFVWSGGVNPAASLTVSPHRLQHFSTESLSLICEGNSAEWRVIRADEDGRLSSCYYWGEMTGSTCNTDTTASSGVYWCESETQFSNAANITIHSGDVILVSPVRPVTEGHSVTLGCKLRTENLLYNVDFYKNNTIIPNPVRGELLISAVTKSDEGFYKCRGRKSPQGLETLTSAESWLSVKYEEAASSSVFLVPLVVGLVSGVLLIILLLLFLRRYRKSEATRSQRTNQSPATDHMINQGETKDGHYASLLPGDSCLYEAIGGSEEPEHGAVNPVCSSHSC
uniref:Ig-like domain-containing protein n=1 Tax=Gasterosteus aculeatus aculeatus TaxID=481459 RepID=A0AAQ4Q3W7_GASAC